jgi:hypothetical protein
MRLKGQFLDTLSKNHSGLNNVAARTSAPGRVFNGISFREIFAKQKRNMFRNFAKIKEHFREISCFAKMSF